MEVIPQIHGNIVGHLQDVGSYAGYRVIYGLIIKKYGVLGHVH